MRSIRQLCVNYWWASDPHWVVRPGYKWSREQETSCFFFISITTRNYTCRHTESMQHAVRCETKCNEARVRRTSPLPFFSSPLVGRSRDIIHPAIRPLRMKFHSWRIKAAWRPTPCWGHWLAYRGRVCARNRIGTPSPKIWDTPGNRTPDRNVAMIYPWGVALSALAAAIGNVPASLSDTPGRNCNPPHRTTRRSSPPFPRLPGSPRASQSHSDGIDDCAARVRSTRAAF